jgi:putative endonuclease
MEKLWYVYILRCVNASHYVGHTTDIERRFVEHNSGKVHYTKDKRAVKLVTIIGYTDKYKVIVFEKYLKSGSGIAFRNKHLL